MIKKVVKVSCCVTDLGLRITPIVDVPSELQEDQINATLGLQGSPETAGKQNLTTTARSSPPAAGIAAAAGSTVLCCGTCFFAAAANFLLVF